MLNASSQATERCPQCGEQFHTLQELLFHVDAFHPAGVSSGPGVKIWHDLMPRPLFVNKNSTLSHASLCPC